MSTRLVLRNLFGPGQDFASYAWRPFRDGIEIARLYGDGASGPSAALLRYAPGATLPPHGHEDFEHIIVLDGEQRDERGGYDAGTCVIHGPETSHAIASPRGCVVLALWNAPVRFDDDPR